MSKKLVCLALDTLNDLNARPELPGCTILHFEVSLGTLEQTACLGFAGRLSCNMVKLMLCMA